MKIDGVLMEMYDGTFLTEDQITKGFGSDTFKEILKKGYITKAGLTDLGVQMYQMTSIGKIALNNKIY